jgi:hypothetical protein
MKRWVGYVPKPSQDHGGYHLSQPLYRMLSYLTTFAFLICYQLVGGSDPNSHLDTEGPRAL